ncbi:MAG: isoprenyl transferase [Bacteroidales bacterium]|nr:isoprenyl transferase [Bacteroidales bacterium]
MELRDQLMQQIDRERLPQHIAIIMDGNGRWAKERGKQRLFGHQSAIQSVREVSEASAEIGVKYLTLYAFSTENWNRPLAEVSGLMSLLATTITKEVSTMNKNSIKLNAIGDLKSLPEANYKQLMQAIADTSHNTRMTLTLALSYSGRWDLTQATRRMAEDVAQGKLQPDAVNDTLISSYLSTAGMPDPELLIRTSGEERISNFLLWQLAYSELYFTPKYWPDFRKADLYEAILNYQHRERRFGKTSEQVTKK